MCKHYISGLSGQASGDALHSLIELPGEALPILMSLYRDQTDLNVKRDLVHSIWQHRDENSMEWLLGILVKEENEAIWQEALDGLIALKCKGELMRIEVGSQLKSRYITEAIDLLEDGHA